jgi:hypothetical protein
MKAMGRVLGRTSGRWAAAAAVLLAAFAAWAEQPRVLRTVPADGDRAVDAAVAELLVEFDRPMGQSGHSVVGGGPSFPEVTGTPRWVDERTFVLPIRLEPGRDYELSINSERFTNFRSRDGEAAVPHPVRFRTADGPAAERVATLTQEQNEAATARLADLLTRSYSHRDRLGIDWPAAIAAHSDALRAAPTPAAYAAEAARVLASGEDAHLWLDAGTGVVPTFARPVTPNVNRRTLARAVANIRERSRAVAVGRFEDGIGYILIASWDRSLAEQLAVLPSALADLADAPSIIIDVRLNGGGDETLARDFAARFVSEPVVYARNVNALPDGTFIGPFDRVLSPATDEPMFRGRVAVLTGPACVSSAEAFVLMMQAAGAITVGAPTRGSSGNPQPHALGNGVTVFLPSWRALTPAGEPVEGVGLPPDVPVAWPTAEADPGTDPVLDAALRELRR